jgi:NAD(P)H-hydrate epimerase
MKILSASEIKRVDQYTIDREPIASIDLMERAALACEKKLLKMIDHDDSIFVFCGKGNNGGDGMAMARLLYERGFQVKAIVIHYTHEFSADAKTNFDLFKTKFPAQLIEINKEEDLNRLELKGSIIIDAIFGTGLNKTVEGLTADAIEFINKSNCRVISIDMPSGLFADESSINNKHIVKANCVLTLQFPKLAFFMPENRFYVQSFEVVDIGLDQQAIDMQPSACFLLEKETVASLLQPRNKFDHKGTFGHGLLMAGSKGKAGAAIISAKACLRSGAGLLTVHSVPEVTTAVLQQLPEAMSSTDENNEFISETPKPEKFDVIGFGPGIGTHNDTSTVLKKILQYYNGPLVIDADGLNILSENKTWLSFLPPSVILTPHVKEFERLAGKSSDDFDRLKMLREFSLKYKCIVVLKGTYSSIAMPDGSLYFNTSGNPGLAKGGSGDALTGIILGLLTRGYNSPQSALIGTYIHGFAADRCAKKMSVESILASDVIDQLPRAFRKLEELK